MDDRALLRELQSAIQSSAGQGQAAQDAAIRAVLERFGATEADVRRLLGIARRRRNREIAGLRGLLDSLIDQRETDAETALAVDRYLRGRQT